VADNAFQILSLCNPIEKPLRGRIMIESFDIGIFTSTYLIPWGINISLAVMVFVVGKMVANILVGIAVKLMTRAQMDVHLEKVA